jgi:hypothetical protein
MKGKPKKQKQGHRWQWKILHWPVCSHCGLIWLKNEATDKVAFAPCRNGDQD